MKSKICTICALFCLSVLFFFCKKETTSVEESPFFDFLKEASIGIDTVGMSADTWEYGFTFSPLKRGKITKLGIKLPAKGDFTATLWDLSGATPVVLRTKNVHAAVLHADTFDDVPELVVEKGAKLGITVLANAFYRITKPGNASFDFPKTVGNIRIDSFQENINNTGTAAFATNTNDTRVAPCVNVIFIAD